MKGDRPLYPDNRFHQRPGDSAGKASAVIFFDSANALWALDGDGMIDGDEVFAMTDPTDPNSFLGLEIDSASSSQVTVRVQTGNGHGNSRYTHSAMDCPDQCRGSGSRRQQASPAVLLL